MQQIKIQIKELLPNKVMSEWMEIEHKSEFISDSETRDIEVNLFHEGLRFSVDIYGIKNFTEQRRTIQDKTYLYTTFIDKQSLEYIVREEVVLSQIEKLEARVLELEKKLEQQSPCVRYVSPTWSSVPGYDRGWDVAWEVSPRKTFW